ncbi:GGDEF domain-containing protein [Terrarubrum flagellatum]|uniref:GGDEF domain-containing protein n=1 Tax=Terrirubrum flagellatum TaxID=2895980 RepID=UPI003144F345
MSADHEDDERELDDARKALDLIARYQSPANASAFSVWQSYVRKADPALCAAIDEFIAQKGSLNHDDVDFLARTYLDTPVDEKPQQLSAALIKEVDRILEAVELATGGAARYSQMLKQMSARLADDVDQKTLQKMVSQLSDITRQTIVDNEALSLNLNATRAEVASLHATLAEVKQQSLTDELTKLPNRRHFDALIVQQLANVKRRSQDLGLMMIDIDHFKRFNDRHGHLTGDKVLRLVASTIAKHLPPRATAARYGGEEIVILLPEQELFQIMRLAEVIRTDLRGRDLIKRSTNESLGRVTVSGGVAIATKRDTVETLIDRADRCLATAKMLGRDRIVSEDDLPKQKIASAV